MRTLRGRFALALVAVLLATTTVPVLALYLLSASGLVEATYVSEQAEDRRAAVPLWDEPLADLPARTAADAPPEGKAEGRWPLSDPGLGLTADRRVPLLYYDPQTGLWTPQIGGVSGRIELASPAFRFRVDLPAWIAIASLPAIGIAIGLLLSIGLSRSVTRPVAELAQAARAVGRRELGYRVKAGGSRELSDLADSFNRMAEALEQAEAVRRNLMADVAHELRTPLTVLEGNLRAMLDGVHPVDEGEIAALLEDTQHLHRLVEDLRILSLAEAERLPLHRAPADVAQLIRETVAQFSPLAESQEIRLHCHLQGDLVHPLLDANRVRQVLHNLVANALGHTSRGGEVTVRAQCTDGPPGVGVTVEDDGEGIAAHELGRIFDRFYRTSPAQGRDRGGAGLGLAIVRAIVEAHGGQVAAESDGLGRGSRFSFALPYAGTTPPPVSPGGD